MGHLVCFYVRLINLQNDVGDDSIVDWYEEHPLSESQRDKIKNLMNLIESEVDDTEVLDEAFHKAIKELFCWTESRKLLDEVACLVQQFLISMCL